MQATLDWLERSNIFLVALDDRQGWYRYHHLFQQLLQKQLQERMSKDEIAMLHRRASAWFADQGLIEKRSSMHSQGETSQVRGNWWKRNFSRHSSRSS